MTHDSKIFSESFRDSKIAQNLVAQINDHASKPMRFMEVCGTHTMSIFRHGIRSLLPSEITLLSGPGCPVCVTDQQDIDAFIALSQDENVTVATFGDLMRVPGTYTSLQAEVAEGADVQTVYSPMDAVQMAQRRPEKTVVFLGVGFETTTPTIAASILAAQQLGLKNYCVYAAHKTVPHALEALMNNPQVQIDGFILPGHVSVIIGMQAYQPFFDAYKVPCAVAGFEPIDILQGILELAKQYHSGTPALANTYQRAVTDEGNIKARQVMNQVFEPCDARWRGIGVIPQSGLTIREELAQFDAAKRFKIAVVDIPPPKGCACGEILIGAKTPLQCALFRKKCTPMDPVGPCMVSSEGTCAAYYRFHA